MRRKPTLDFETSVLKGKYLYKKKDRQCRYNAILSRVLVTIVTVEKQ